MRGTLAVSARQVLRCGDRRRRHRAIGPDGPAPARRRAAAATVLAVLLTVLSLQPSAVADPARDPGCVSKEFTQKYAVGGVTFYGQRRSIRFCWTGGPVLGSRIKNITGAAYCWANQPNQVQNCTGPADGSKIPIAQSRVFRRGHATVYFWFQSRSCATGPLDMVCSRWSWHGAKYVLKQGGGVILADADV